MNIKRTSLVKDEAGSFQSVELPISVEQFSELVGMIYEGPLETVPWTSALSTMRTILKSNWTLLILRPASLNWPGIMIRAGERGVDLYDAEYIQYPAFSLDPFVGLPPDRIVTVDETIDVVKWSKSEFHKRFMEPFNIRYIMGSDIHSKVGGECRLRWTRPPLAKDFSASDKALCQMLLPHFKRAVDNYFRSEVGETERLIYVHAMDRMLVGTVILDEKGMILRCNKTAVDILAEKDGILKMGGRLHSVMAQEDRRLQKYIAYMLAISELESEVPKAMSLSRFNGRHALGILLRQIPMDDFSKSKRRPAVAVFIRDPERKQKPSHEVVMQLFGLTSREATLAMLLASGLSSDEAAERLNMSKNTVRAHLRAIFSKTSVTRQSELVRLLLSSVASIV